MDMALEEQIYKLSFINHSMADEVHVHQPGSIAGSPELSRFVLESEYLLDDLVKAMSGEIRQVDADGNIVISYDSKKAFNQECIAWMRSKVQEVLNKNMSLSNYETPAEMYREALSMSVSFKIECWLFTEKFKLKPETYYALCDKYDNYLSPAIRAPLRGGIRNLLTSTHSESTQTIRSSNVEERSGGLISRLTGKG